MEDRVLLVGDALDEVPVVRDHQQGSRPGIEEVFHRREHVGVEVVGRLVENQHVRLLEQDHQQLEAALLATREVLHRRRQLRAREPHPLEQLPGRQLLRFGPRTERVRRAKTRDDHADGIVHMPFELVQALGQRRDLHGLAPLDATRGRLDGAGDEPEEGRLSGAVHPEDSGALTGRDPPLDGVQHFARLAGRRSG